MNFKTLLIPLFIVCLIIPVIGCGENGDGDEPIPKPDVPTNLSVESKAGYIELTWDTADNSDFYNIYRRTESESEFKLIGSTEDGSITYKDDKVEVGKTYYYRVAGLKRGEDINQEGRRSEEKSTTYVMSKLEIVLPDGTNFIDFGESRAAQIVKVKNAQTGTLNWKVAKVDKKEWLEISPISGKVNAGEEQNITIKIVSDKLEGLEGEQSATIKFTNDDVPDDEKTVAVKIRIVDKPRVCATAVDGTTEITFASLEDTPAIKVENCGTGTLSWSAIKDKNVEWLSFSPEEGKLAKGKNQSVTLELDTNLIQNLLEEEQTETIKFINQDDEKDQATVTVKIGEHPRLSVPQKKLDFGTIKTEDEISIRNFGTGTLEWKITFDDANAKEWLTIKPSSGNTKLDPDEVTFIVDRTKSEGPGTYSTSVTVTATKGGEEKITVQMKVAEGELSVSDATLPFGDSKDTLEFTITNDGEGALEWKAATDKPSWIKIEPANGKLDAGDSQKVKVTVIRAELNAGGHDGEISITSNVGDAVIKVNLTKIGLLIVVVYDEMSEKTIGRVEVAFKGETKNTIGGRCQFTYQLEGTSTIEAQADGYIPGKKSFTTNQGYASVDIFLKPIPGEDDPIRNPKNPFEGPKRIAFSADGSWAYVTNEAGDSVSIINTTGANVDEVVELKCGNFGCAPKGIAANPERPEVYVASAGSDQISIINTDKKEDIKQIKVGDEPTDLVVSPDGGRLYVVNMGHDNVAVINLDNRKVVNEISVGQEPAAIAISANGRELYVANEGEGSVSIIDANTEQEIKRIPVTRKPNSIAVSPDDGQFIYAASEVSTEVSVINRSNRSLEATFNVATVVGGIAVAQYKKDEVVFVASFGDGIVTLIDMASKTVVAEKINIGSWLEDIAYNPMRQEFYLPDSINSSVEVLEFR